jgi:murein L,D-transpeptidase YafK
MVNRTDSQSQNVIKQIYDIMGKHYDRIKEEVGLKDALDNSDNEEEMTEAIYKRLRPQSQHKFKKILEQGDSKAANRMMGPMAVNAFDNAREVDVRPKKRKIERHRFADPPEYTRPLQMMIKESSDNVPDVVTVIGGHSRGPSLHMTEHKPHMRPSEKIASKLSSRPFTAA